MFLFGLLLDHILFFFPILFFLGVLEFSLSGVRKVAKVLVLDFFYVEVLVLALRLQRLFRLVTLVSIVCLAVERVIIRR